MKGILSHESPGRHSDITFNNAIRFIDDILLIDPHHSFHKHIVSTSDDIDPIYPSYLQLSQTSASTTEVGYLGIQISLHRNHINTSIYDKRREFSFKVNQYPYFHSTIPQHIVKGVLNGQLTRYGRLCSQSRHFAYNAARLILTLNNNGYNITFLKKLTISFIFKFKFAFMTPHQSKLRRLLLNNLTSLID